MSLPACDILVILGSGMGHCFGSDELEEVERISTSVAGHAGSVGLMRREGRRILVSSGRRHLYEGVSAAQAAEVVDRAADAGARALIVTNAAGSLDPRWSVGDIMAIVGTSAMMLGRRLADRGGASGRHGGIDSKATLATVDRALERGLILRQGVYAAVLGPSYESRAEIRMLRRLGAQAVGMSTAPEIACASRRGLRVVGLSLLTNVVSDTLRVELDHNEVVIAGMRSAEKVRAALECALEALR